MHSQDMGLQVTAAKLDFNKIIIRLFSILSQSIGVDIYTLFAKVMFDHFNKIFFIEQAGVKVDERGLIPVDAQSRTNIPHIYAIGDIVAGFALAHKASYEGKVAAEAISGMKTTVDYRAMPAVCYTDTSIATTGLTLAEAKEQGFSI